MTSSRLDSDGWKIGGKQNCEASVNYHNNTITIKWEENSFVTNKRISFYISGHGVDYVLSLIHI